MVLYLSFLMSLCFSVSTALYQTIQLYICLSNFLSKGVYIYVYLHLNIYTLYFCLSVFLLSLLLCSLYLCVSSSVCLSICVSLNPFAFHLRVSPSFFLSICFSPSVTFRFSISQSNHFLIFLSFMNQRRKCLFTFHL